MPRGPREGIPTLGTKFCHLATVGLMLEALDAQCRETISGIPLYVKKWDAIPLPLACELEVQYPHARRLSQRYLREATRMQGKLDASCDAPLGSYLQKALRYRRWGVSQQWATKGLITVMSCKCGS